MQMFYKHNGSTISVNSILEEMRKFSLDISSRSKGYRDFTNKPYLLRRVFMWSLMHITYFVKMCRMVMDLTLD